MSQRHSELKGSECGKLGLMCIKHSLVVMLVAKTLLCGRFELSATENTRAVRNLSANQTPNMSKMRS
jgi:hypothetical protein